MYETILRDLKSEKEYIRRQAIEDLFKIYPEELEHETIELLINESQYVYKDNREIEKDASNFLIQYVAQFEYEEMLPLLQNVYPKVSKFARSSILDTFTQYASEQSAKLLFDTLNTYLQTHEIDSFHPFIDSQNTEEMALFFPGLLDFAYHPVLKNEIYALLAEGFYYGSVKPQNIAPYITNIISEYIQYRETIKKIEEQPLHHSFLWSSSYQKVQNPMFSMLNIFGYFRHEKIEGMIEDALSFQDPKLKLAAAVALIKNGYIIHEKFLIEIAENDVYRNFLYEELRRLGCPQYFPNQFHSQEQFARSALVEWLTFPMELGEPPIKVELVQVFEEVDPVYGDVEYFLYRFRSDKKEWRDKGWMAGLSGCFIKGVLPSTEGKGYTLSDYVPWENKTPVEHFEHIKDIVNKNWEQFYDEDDM